MKEFKLSKRTQKHINLTKVKLRLLVGEFELKYELDRASWFLCFKCASKGTELSGIGTVPLTEIVTITYQNSKPLNWVFNISLRRALKELYDKIENKLGCKQTSVIL